MNDTIFSLILKIFFSCKDWAIFCNFLGGKEPLAMPAVTFILEKEKMQKCHLTENTFG